MKSINKRKNNFDAFAWKIVDLLNKSKDHSSLSREEKSLYNEWIEDIEDYGIIIIPQNRVLEMNRENDKIFLLSAGIFNDERLISGFEVVLSKPTNQNIEIKKINYYYADNQNVKNVLENSFEQINTFMKNNEDQSNKIEKNPINFLYCLLDKNNETNDLFLNVDKINEELGKNIKDYLIKKNNI
jgi:hypothetical protein